MKKKVTTLLVVALTIVLCFSLIGCNAATQQQETRTVPLSDGQFDAQGYLEGFDNYELTQEDSITKFSGTKSFDASLLSELDLVSVGTQESYDVQYIVTMDESNNNVSMTAILQNGINEPIMDTVYGLSIDINGKSDVVFVIDGEAVYLSDMIDSGVIKTDGLFSIIKNTVAAVVTAVTIVTPVAQVAATVITVVTPAITAVAAMSEVVGESMYGKITRQVVENNYNHNLNQYIWLNNGYIEDQYQYSAWKYGLKTMDENGCGVMAAFNTLKHLGKINNVVKDNVAKLAEIAKDFESGHGTLVAGYGGTNTTHIATYFLKQGLKVNIYAGIAGQTEFQWACNSLKTNQVAVLAYWWLRGGIKMDMGGHYITITKTSTGYVVNNNNKDSFSDATSYLKGIPGESRGFLTGWIVSN